jgi:hypothetical protein
MSAENQSQGLNFVIDSKNLYREESYTDMKAGAIRRLVPVNADGSEDKARTSLFVGTTQLMTPEGALPIQAQLMANNLAEAIEAFPGAMQGATQKMIAEIEKLRQNQKEKDDSRIIVPGR